MTVENVTETMARLPLNVNHRIAIHDRANPHDSNEEPLLRRRNLHFRVTDEAVGQAGTNRDVAAGAGAEWHVGGYFRAHLAAEILTSCAVSLPASHAGPRASGRTGCYRRAS